MAIVIDANTFSQVFEQDNAEHHAYKPVLDWIEKGWGFMVYGGTKYNAEILTSYRRTRLVRLLQDAGRAVRIKTDNVDCEEARITRLTAGTDCNDPHIIALLIVANCTLLCSSDKESYPHVKNKKLYPKKFPSVKIYTGKRNTKKLLVKTSRCEIRNSA